VLGHGWLAVILAVSVMGWCVFSLQDAVLTGTRQAVWVPLENGLYNLGKIGLLLALAPVSQRYGIFASWIVPALVALVPVNLLIFRRILPRHASAGTRAPAVAPLRTMTRFVGGDYLGSIFMLATIDLLPVLVVTRLGAEANGYFYVPFMIVVALDLVTIYLGMALTVEGAHDDSRLQHLVASVVRRVCLFVVPAVAILLVFGPLVLRLYGPVYAEHSVGLLRLLALAVLVRVARSLYVSLSRVHRQVSRIALTQGAVFVLTMGLSWWLMGRMGLFGIGVAVLVTELLTAAVVIPVMLVTLAGKKPAIAVTGAE
jgi:O-antigen/teichoic acid export membrane protein